jgi:hypothetical protein
VLYIRLMHEVINVITLCGDELEYLSHSPAGVQLAIMFLRDINTGTGLPGWGSLRLDSNIWLRILPLNDSPANYRPFLSSKRAPYVKKKESNYRT